MNKGFWTGKDLTGVDPAYQNQLRNDPKRTHDWFADPNEVELFPNKKQAVQTPNNKSNPGMLSSNALPWVNPPSYSQVPNPFMDRLFGNEGDRPFNLVDRHDFPVCTTVIEDLNMTSKGINKQYGNDTSVGLSMSHALVDADTACLNYGGFRKVNHVKDSDISGQALVQAYNTENENSFLPVRQDYSKEDECVLLMGHTYNKGDCNVRSLDSTFGKGPENGLSFDHSHDRGQAITSSYGIFNGETHIDHLAQPVNSGELIYEQSSAQATDLSNKKGSRTSNQGATKAKSEALAKAKDVKGAKKEFPSSFPSNVKSLISTGVLDGVPIKYIAISREELPGIIKGSGYLCGCKDCNFTKALNAYKFESHAGFKTKHPNNHIYFESGKTIYQIVQELKATPELQLFEAVQSITGSPINQKAFRIWKESYQAASRELRRIYGKS